MCMGLITKLSGSITATFSTLPGKVATKLMSFSLRLRSDFVKKKYIDVLSIFLSMKYDVRTIFDNFNIKKFQYIFASNHILLMVF